MRWFVSTFVVLVQFAGGAVLGEQLLQNGDFETVYTIGNGPPTAVGFWEGDDSEIVTAQNGITPYDGSRMLHFLYASRAGPSSGSIGGEVYQLLAVTPWADEIAAGRLRTDLSVFVNRVAGDAQTDTSFSCTIIACDGLPALFLPTTYLDFARYDFSSDANTATWEETSTSLVLPTGTPYVAAKVQANEDVYNDASAPEFDGHYADHAVLTVTVIPEPSAIAWFVIVTLIGLLGRIRRSA